MIKRMKRKQRRKVILAAFGRGFGVLGYISCTLQWLWVGVVALPPLLKSGLLDSLTKPKQVDHPILLTPSFETSPLTVAIIGFITLIMLAVTIYILLRLPGAVAKTGETIVQTTTENVLPVLTHHQKLPAKKKRLLTRRVAFYIRLCALVLPFVITMLLPPIKSLPPDVVIFIASWLALFSMVFFGGSYLLPATVSRKPAPRH